MNHLPVYLAAVFAVLSGTITDKTTGQPLQGVTVTATAGAHTLRTKTDAEGHFVLSHVNDGDYALHLSSRDVPAQTVHVRVHGASTHVTLKACSTTLDYSCGAGDSSGG
ncbi:MAG: DUF2012 domain-containing protein [Candidatus Eremiobacteraeota bacterium]|nr:DUF2012 domain-containing protein [Candidatus Eremiobacteraeota bacterium]